MGFFDHVATLGGYRFGLTHDLVMDNGEPYLERWIIWCGITLRLHKFIKSDDDRAFHDHPWWFITLPLRAYNESLPGQADRTVSPWRPHFRAAAHQHIVRLRDHRPVWTLIVTGAKSKEWGFWNGATFIPHEQWLQAREAEYAQTGQQISGLKPDNSSARAHRTNPTRQL